MIKLVHLSILLFMFSGAALGCGDGQSNSNPTTASSPTPTSPTIPITPTLTEYQFSATIDQKMGTTPFPVALGDTVTGTFTFNPAVQDTYVLPTQGGYVQKAPASVQIKLGSITMNADLNNWLGYIITITPESVTYL